MDVSSRFSWSQLGKADYSQSAALVANMPASLRRKLKHRDEEVLRRIVYLCWRYAVTSGRGHAYCIPSESWLAGKIERSVRTVQRCLIRLKEAGLLTWRARMGKADERLSNLYELGKSFLASLYARKREKVQQIHPTTRLSHNDLKKGIEVAPPTGASSDSGFSIKSMVSSVAISLAKRGEMLREDRDEEKKAVLERKAALRKQYLALPESIK